jgi:TRAP-type C4-dicarboxylate transport system permease small subunit
VSRIVLVPIGIGFILVVFLGVLTRYVFHAPIITSVELARIGFVWSAFLGAAICLKSERHTQFLFLLDRLRGPIKEVVRAVIALVSVGFFLFLTLLGVRMVQAVQDTYFPALGWSQLWMYVPLPLCSGIMFVHSVAFLARDLRGLFAGTRQGAGS